MQRHGTPTHKGGAAQEPPARQLSFPLVAAPLRVKDHGLKAAHVRPYVARIRDKGRRAGQMWSGRVPCTHAWAYQWINLQDAGATWATLTYDCDNRRTMEGGLADLPPWNWRVETERGAHLTWCLADPVGRLEAHRPGPQRMLSRASEYFHHALDADPAFNGLGRNPTHELAETTWGAERPYYLDALCDVIPFRWKRPRIAQTAIGRQVTLWETALLWAGSECNAGLSVLAMLHTINADVAEAHGKDAMPPHVLADIAQRVERYRAGWMVKGWHKPAWIERQRKRGSAGGKAKAGKPVAGKVQASATAEMTDTDLAKTLGVHRTTLGRWKRAGTLEAKMHHLANTVNAPSSAQKLGRNLVELGTSGGGSGGRLEDADPLAPLMPPADKTPSPALGDMRDPETRRFWQDRAARIAAERAEARARRR
ncbi:MAG: hypothetical protein F4Z77_13160 [Dehalococcoidia bacterium]|nr:hypothetical protein [Dehalococcoidia bacterium]